MFRSIIPREEVFFDHFEKICALMTEAAKALRAMLENGGAHAEAAQGIKALEGQADELTHRSIAIHHKTFVTPPDRQDILRLIVGLAADYSRNRRRRCLDLWYLLHLLPLPAR